MMQSTYPYYLANTPSQPNLDLEVIDKYSGECITRVAVADIHTINKAIEAAVDATEPMRRLPPYTRQQILNHCVSRFQTRKEELAHILCIEAGKPIKDSRGEVDRLIDTFRVAAEEAVRINGDVLNLEISKRTHGYRGMVKRVPIGPCSFIAPFNFPLNLVAHKVAPAIAAGCPFILKPASFTPVGALIIGEILAETELPKGSFSILPCHRDGADLFTTDDRLKLLSFTGSPDIGWKLKTKAGKKKVVLELGGNAACIVNQDADIDDAVDRIIIGAFYQSGQSCISVQRILVHSSIYEPFRNALVKKTSKLVVGDPKNEDTFIGPVISLNEANRLKDWVEQAVTSGGRLLCGGAFDGQMMAATLIENISIDQPIYNKEAFGPVAVISRYKTFDEAIQLANDSDFGLQVGVFTSHIGNAMRAWDEIDVGGVVINDVPSWRVDNMPYGGVKDSGLGREGVRYAIEDISEPRLLVIRDFNNQ